MNNYMLDCGIFFPLALDSCKFLIHLSKVTTLQARQKTAAERNLIKKAVKNAMDDLKAKDTGLFLGSNALKVKLNPSTTFYDVPWFKMYIMSVCISHSSQC